MYDILPFPNILSGSAEAQVVQINNYLIQLKEALEFVLTNISTENLSQDLITKLNNLGVDVEKSKEVRDDQLIQIVNKTLSISDVINSEAFKLSIKESSPIFKIEEGGLKVSYDKGETWDFLGYIQGEKRQDGKNGVDGKTPNISFSVNFSTGNLEYTTS